MKRLIVLIFLLASPCWSQSEEVKKDVVQEARQEVKKRRARVFDKQFWFAIAAVVGTTILDVETTAACIKAHTCGERNPLFGKFPSRAKMYGIKGSVAGFIIFSTWWWKSGDANDFDTYGHQFERGAKQPRAPADPRSKWWVPSTVYISCAGAAGLYNIARSHNFKHPDPVLPAQMSRYPGN